MYKKIKKCYHGNIIINHFIKIKKIHMKNSNILLLFVSMFITCLCIKTVPEDINTNNDKVNQINFNDSDHSKKLINQLKRIKQPDDDNLLKPKNFRHSLVLFEKNPEVKEQLKFLQNNQKISKKSHNQINFAMERDGIKLGCYQNIMREKRINKRT